MTRLVIALAALVVAAWCVATPRPEPVALVAKATATEGILERRMDTETFRARWRDVADMPPMREQITITEPVLLVHTERVITTRRVALHGDLCSRHGMRKVHYGKRWRCRR